MTSALLASDALPSLEEKDCSSVPKISWRFSQCFGERSDTTVNADIISSLEFDETGTYLATGDRGGRIVIFKDTPSGFSFFAEFQSHEPEFDYLKSVEIEERINKIKWCKYSTSRDSFLLTTNDTVIKLWKLSSRRPKKATAEYEPRLHATHQRSFKTSNLYHLNSISPNIDGLSFLSADDLRYRPLTLIYRIALWQIEDPRRSLTLIDLKPPQIEDLIQVITTASFHPQCTHQFLFGTSRGTVRLCDTRLSSLCDSSGAPKKIDSETMLFGDLLLSVSDAKYSFCGRFVVSRDFQMLRIWDTRQPDLPLSEIPVPPDSMTRKQIQNRFLELYQTEVLFEDRFECGFDGTSRYVYTGTYENTCHIFDLEGNTVSSIFSDKSIFENCKPEKNRPLSISKKILTSVWSPNGSSMALAAANNLFIFRAFPFLQ